MLRRLLIPALLLLFIARSVDAYFPIGPDHRLDQPSYNLLSNKFLVIKNLGQFVLAVTEDGFLFYTVDPTDSVIVPVSKVYTPFTPVSVRRLDNQLIFRSDDNTLYFYDISNLPEATYQRKIALGIPFADYAIDGRFIYVSRWFDGISRYLVNSISKIILVDSSMKGILVTQLVRSDTCLYALDEYNGIMRYRVRRNGFGTFIDYLHIPERPYKFILSDSGALVQTFQPNVYHGKYRKEQSGTSMVYDSVPMFTANQLLIRKENLLVLAGERDVSLVDMTDSMEVIRRFQLDDLQPDGDIVYLGTTPYLLLPGKTNGAMFIPLGETGDPFPAISRPGIISGIALHKNKLITAGAANPIDVYTFDSLRKPEFSYTIPNTPANVRATDLRGDTLAVLYSPGSRIDLIVHPTESDSVEVLSMAYQQTDRAIDIHLYSRLRDSIPAVVVQQVNQLQMIPWPTGDTLAPSAHTWALPAQSTCFYIQDSLLMVATNKGNMLFYTIMASFDTRYRSVLNLSKEAHDFFSLDPQHILLFCERVISRCDISNPSAPHIDSSIVLPLTITKVAEDKGVLFGIGPNGIGVFSLKSGMPVLIDRGGKWGTLISTENGIVATSDGSAIYLYMLRDYSNNSLPAPPPQPQLPQLFTLRQNYPNPFNGKTRIMYDIPQTGHVLLSVYNILGQRVITLVDAVRLPGTYEVEWDGKSENGKEAATGVYYYRLTSETTHITKKMILVK